MTHARPKSLTAAPPYLHRSSARASKMRNLAARYHLQPSGTSTVGRALDALTSSSPTCGRARAPTLRSISWPCRLRCWTNARSTSGARCERRRQRHAWRHLHHTTDDPRFACAVLRNVRTKRSDVRQWCKSAPASTRQHIH